jgi:hypothetical protein
MLSALASAPAGAAFEFLDIPQFGRDATFRIRGGCERDGSGGTLFGFPDRYMDAGEKLPYMVLFQSSAIATDVALTLHAVEVDIDSPADCLWGSTHCADPDRLNNALVSGDVLKVLGSPFRVGTLPAATPTSVNFTVAVADTLGAMQKIEMIVCVSSTLTPTHCHVDRHVLDADELSTFYSTDFPGGGVSIRDYNNDEVEQNPDASQRFETIIWSDIHSGLDATGAPKAVNTAVEGPWDFEGSDEGFVSGLVGVSDPFLSGIANWGEDKNFNGIEDGMCQADLSRVCYTFPQDIRCPAPGFACNSYENEYGDQSFVRNRSSRGGCGWQTRSQHYCSADTARGCETDADCLGRCEVPTNSIASTLDPCDGIEDCPMAHQCSEFSSNPLAPCDGDEDCPGGSCEPVLQVCQGAAGPCDPGSFMETGGVWHTGRIGPLAAACTGTDSGSCERYQTVTITGGASKYFELLATPILEKRSSTSGSMPTATRWPPWSCWTGLGTRRWICPMTSRW